MHAHKYVGKTNGRLLVSQTRGGLHEGFFEELGERRGTGLSYRPRSPPGIRRIVSIAVSYGIEITSPPGP